MAQCEINRNTITNGIVKAVENKINATNLFMEEDGIYTPKLKQDSSIIKEGVSSVFTQSPELAAIGSPKDYSDYLNTIFPDSKSKDILYHGTRVKEKFEAFDKTKRGTNTFGGEKASKSSNKGFFFSSDHAYSKEMSKDEEGEYNNIYHSVVNIKNPSIAKSDILLDGMISPTEIDRREEFIDNEIDKAIKEKKDGVIIEGKMNNNRREEWEAKEVIVFEPEQIHILGSKKDVEGFKNWKNNRFLGTHEEAVNNINSQFGEEIIMRFEGDDPLYTITEPSDKLVNQYLSSTAGKQVKAPNGQPSKLFQSLSDVLPAEQAIAAYNKTQTPQFKEWFGESKVVDENGEPQVVFHGSDKNFDVFDTVKKNEFTGTEHGAYFTSNYDYAEAHAEENGVGNVMPVFLRIENPKNVKDEVEFVPESAYNKYVKAGNDGLINEAEEQIVIFDPNQVKSVNNRGSFLKTENETNLDPQYANYERFMINVSNDGKKVGEMWVENDGEYLTLYSAQITGQGSAVNVGTNAHLKLAALAKNMGLQFRSDTLQGRMSDASIRTWDRFVAAGQAELIGDRYYFTGEANDVSDNIFLNAQEPLSQKENKEFTRLQDEGLISMAGHIVDGKTYYKIPDVDGQKNEETKSVLESLLKSRGINFIHIIDSPEAYLIEVGEQEGEDLDTPSADEEAPIPKKVDREVTKKRVLRFLENIGFRDIQVVNQLIHNGKPIPGSAYIDLMHGIMQIVKGSEDYSLPEEAMHILEQLISESRPELHAQMMKEIINYQIYRDLLVDPDYIENKLYQKEDGTPDYDKLKREAIGKLLAEYLISDLEGETDRRVERAFNWWQSIIQWIREVFGNYKNPFEAALSELENDDKTFGEFADISSDDIFLSAKSVAQIDAETPENKEIWNRIKSKAANLGITKQNDKYYKNGVEVAKAGRVSDLVKAYYDKLFKGKALDPGMEEFYEQSRKDGSYLHQIAEEVINSYIDPSTGLMMRNPAALKFPLVGNPIQGQIVSDLKKYIKEFMAGYPVGTRFITEQIIYDEKEDRYGTIDFQAVRKDGTVDIIDWKSMLLEDAEGAKDYKRQGIFVQMNEYKRILKDEYGVEKFGKIRAIPIKKNYRTASTGVRVLMNIAIGDADPAKIDKENRALRPIISPQESTGSEFKDELITKLEGLYKKYIEKGYFQKDVNILSDVQEAIYEIRVTNSVENLSNYFTDLRTRFSQLVAEGNKLKDASKEDISEALAMISFYEDIMENVVEPSVHLQEDPSILKESRQQLYRSASDLNFLARKLKDLRANLVNGQAAKEGIFGLLLPEKAVNLAKRWFRSMGSQDIATVRYMYELVKKAYGKIDLAIDSRLKDLKNLKYDFDNWKKRTGTSNEDAVKKLVDTEKGRLHSKIDKEFFKKREEVRASQDAAQIIKFINDNYDTAPYEQWYKTQLAENMKIWNNSTYVMDKAHNARIIKAKILQFEKSYDLSKYPVTAFGYHNTLIWGKNIKEDKWLSNEYKEIAKHPELLAMYNYFVQINKELADTGAIKDYEAYTFIPNVRKDLATILMDSDKNILQKGGTQLLNQVKNFRASLSVSDYQLNYQGQIDPFTGEKLEKRFIPYVQHLDSSDKSFDLFSIYGLLSKEVFKEQYLSENDEILRSLVHIEKMKPTLQANKFGVIATDPAGRPVVSDKLGANSQILEEHVKGIVNGEKLQYDGDFVVKFKLREKWNKTPLGKLYQFDTNPETYNPTAISATKFLMWLNTANQKRILGVNAASAISNLFGGTFASTKLHQKYLSREDLYKAMTKFTSGGFYQSDEMKKNAALVDYFLPLLQNRESFKSSQLSVSDASKVLSQEWLMSPMRKTSEIVQLNIFLALMENTGIINGKVVNLRQLAMEETNYNDRYTNNGAVATPAQIAEVEAKFQARLKSLKDQFRLSKLAKFTTIKEAGKNKVILEIPGINRHSADIENIREIVQTMSKDALGEADEFDLANYKYSIWWRLFMTFKNWIPRQADVRFGEFRYDQAHHSYEYGRFRMFARAISANYVQTALKLVPLPYITGAITNKALTKTALIEKAKETYLEKMSTAKKLGTYNKDTFISEGEFIDKFIQGSESTFAEMRTLIFMMGLLFAGVAAPDGDDDPSDKAYKALARKQINKLIDEVGFFYSPKSGIDIAGGGAPVFSVIRDGWYLGSDIGEQFFGFTFSELGATEKGDKMQETAKPIKRTFKMFPVLKEILTYLPAVNEDISKEWGVKISDRRAF